MYTKLELPPINQVIFPLMELPEDLLAPILSFFGIKELILKISLVNKNWHVIAVRLIEAKINVKKEEMARRYIAI